MRCAVRTKGVAARTICARGGATGAESNTVARRAAVEFWVRPAWTPAEVAHWLKCAAHYNHSNGAHAMVAAARLALPAGMMAANC